MSFSENVIQSDINDNSCFVNIGHTDGQIKKLIEELSLIKSVDNSNFETEAKKYEEIISKYLREKDIDVNLFIACFKRLGFRKFDNLIEILCSRKDLVNQFNEKSVKDLCAVYDYHINEVMLYNLKKQIRTILLNKNSSKKDLNNEVVYYLELDSLNYGLSKNKYFSVLRDSDMKKLNFLSSDLLYILRKIDFDLPAPERILLNLELLLERNSKNVTNEVSSFIYRKLVSLSEKIFEDDNNAFNIDRFLLFKYLGDEHINAVIRKKYVKGGDNTKFLLALSKSVRDKSTFSQKLLSLIIDDIKNCKDEESLQKKFGELAVCLIAWEVSSFDESNSRKLFDLMVSDTSLALKILSPSSYKVESDNVKVDFIAIKNHLAIPLHETRVGYITELLVGDKTLDSYSVLCVVSDVVNNLDNEKIGADRVNRMVKDMYDLFFTWQTKSDVQIYGQKFIEDEREAAFMALEFIRLRLLHYLERDNKYRLLKKAFHEDTIGSDIIRDAVIDNYFEPKEFNYLWKKMGEKEKRFTLIGDVYNMSRFEDINGSTLRSFNDFLEYNFDGFVDYYFAKGEHVRKPDLVVDYVNSRYPFSSANMVFGQKHTFESDQWKKMFKSFYTTVSDSDVDSIFKIYDSCSNSEDFNYAYMSFHDDYKNYYNDVEVNNNGEVSRFTVDQFNEHFFKVDETLDGVDSLFGKLICPNSSDERYVGVVQISHNDLLVSSLVKDSCYPRDEENDSEAVFTRIIYDDIDTITVKQYKAKCLSERILDLVAESMPCEECVDGYDYHVLDEQDNYAKVYVCEESCEKTLEFTIKNPIVARDFIGNVREKVCDIKNPTWRFKDCLTTGNGIFYNSVNDDGCYYSGALKVKK